MSYNYSLNGRSYEMQFDICENTIDIICLKIWDATANLEKKNINFLIYDPSLLEETLLEQAIKASIGAELLYNHKKTLIRLRRHFISEKNSFDGFTGLTEAQFKVAIQLISHWRTLEYDLADDFFMCEVANLTGTSTTKDHLVGVPEGDIISIRDSIHPGLLIEEINPLVRVFESEIWPTLQDQFLEATKSLVKH